MADNPGIPADNAANDHADDVTAANADRGPDGGAYPVTGSTSPDDAVEPIVQPAPIAPPQASSRQGYPSQHTGAAFQAPAGEQGAVKTRRRVPAGAAVAAVAVAALIGGLSGAGVASLANSRDGASTVSGNPNPASITVNDSNSVTQTTAVAAKASPSVVTINVSSSDSGGTGSGIIISKDGYILTNTHVVTLDGQAGEAKIEVTTNDGRLLPAKLVGTDPVVDLAVIKVDADGDLPPAEFADSSMLNVGETAIAIGAPLGLAGTVTDGIISSLNRSITIASSAAPGNTQDDSPQPPDNLFNFDVPGLQNQGGTASSTISLPVIQTDAAINPGNSGGALLNSDAQVIGVNVAIASAGGSSSGGQSGNIGVGFSIPSQLAQRVAKEIIATGSASHGLLGASVADVTDTGSTSKNEVVGAEIRELSPDGAAAKAGLKVGDVVTKLGDIPITSKTDLTAQIRAQAGGADVAITYYRDGGASQVDATLGTL